MTTSLRSRPAADEYPPFYSGYVAAIPDGDIIALLRSTGEELKTTLARIPESKGSFRYADDKWSIKVLLGHVIDGERIFTYRALRVARGDQTPLPGFEENDFAVTSKSDARTVADLAAELAAVRESSVRLFESLPDEAWTRRGTVSGKSVSVRALAYITAGHAKHHLNVLRERYGVA
jgi:hypothetical protein